MVTICLQCGDEGAQNALVFCIKCLDYAVHRYCLDELPETLDEFVPWVCDDCDFVVPQEVRPSKCAQSERKACTNPGDPESSSKKGLLERETTKLVSDTSEAKLDENAKLTGERVPLELKKKTAPVASTLNGRKQLQESACRQQLMDTNSQGGSLNAESTGNEGPVKDSLKKKYVRKNLLQKDEHRLKSRNSGKPYEERSSKEITERSKLSSDPDLAGVENKKAFVSKAKLDDRHQQHEENTLLEEIDPAHDLLPSNKVKSKKTDFGCSSSIAKQDNRHRQHDENAGLEEIVHTRNNLPTKSVELPQGLKQQVEAHCSTFSKPSSNSESACHECAQPVIDPIWTGSFNILNAQEPDEEINRLVVAHLSNKVGKQVYNEAKSFPSEIDLEMHPKADVWPKKFQGKEPSDDHIAVYFFPMSKRYEGVFDELVEEMMVKKLAMKAITKTAELLVFPSNELPIDFWRFQGKYFLWGVFRGKQADPSKAVKEAERTTQ